MEDRTGSKVGLFGISLGVVALLSGCGPVPFIGAHETDEGLEIRICDPIPTNDVLILTGAQGVQPRDRELVWEFSGEETRSLDSITYGMVPPGMTSVVGPSMLQMDQVLRLEVYHMNSREVLQSRFATFNLNELSEDYWLMADGSKKETPCD